MEGHQGAVLVRGKSNDALHLLRRLFVGPRVLLVVMLGEELVVHAGEGESSGRCEQAGDVLRAHTRVPLLLLDT